MAVKSSFTMNDPASIEMTMCVTMTVKEWIKLKDSVRQTESFWDTENAFCRSIAGLVDKAQKEFIAYETSNADS